MLTSQRRAKATQLPEPLVTGDDRIDHEHAMLLGQLDFLRGATALSTRDEGVSDALHNISQVLLSHFDHEEAIMRDSAIPASAYSAHRNAHRTIIEEMSNLQTRMMRTPIMVFELLATLERWIEAHIREFDLQDMRYV